MRTIYLIRHGKVAFHGKKCCIGRTDLPLSEGGRNQALELASYFHDKDLTIIYTSPLERARSTADLLAQGRWPIEACPLLTELNMGDWEGLTFSEIKDTWPALYAERGQNPESVVPPNGETLSDAMDRIGAVFQQILSHSSGNIAIVAHSAVNRLLICKLAGLPLRSWASLPQPYGCVTTILINGNDIRVEEIGRMPLEVPGDDECFSLISQRETPRAVVDHCRAVAAKADEVAAVFTKQGFSLNAGIVHAGALLHDIARVYPRHAQLGASWIRAAGYLRIARVVEEHELLPEPIRINESAVVYLADKLIQGTKEVSLEERFTHSLEKCRDEAARQNHEMRAGQAFFLLNKFLPVHLSTPGELVYENGKY
jgi:alpha-ribazole phosphatase